MLRELVVGGVLVRVGGWRGQAGQRQAQVGTSARLLAWS